MPTVLDAAGRNILEICIGKSRLTIMRGIWFSQIDERHLFSLKKETRDIYRQPDAETRIRSWRKRMVEFPKDHLAGFINGKIVLLYQRMLWIF